MRKTRTWRYKGYRFDIDPGVFYPYLTKSTYLLLNYLDEIDLKNKRILDVGCGSGILVTYAAKLGAISTGIDISDLAGKNTLKNAQKHGVHVEFILSDLFQNLPETSFDHVLINPPYYPKKPETISENAWYCGADFEYFHRLFEGIHERGNLFDSIVMILCEDCDLETIMQIAQEKRVSMTVIRKQVRQGEENILYRLEALL